MRFLLTAKHWQVFLVVIFGLFLTSFRLVDYPTITVTLNTIGFLVYFLWPMLVARGLQDYLPPRITLSDTFFLINGFLSMATILGILVFTDGQGMTFTGLAALPMFYVFFAFLYYLAFPGRTLRTIENKRDADFGDYFSDFFLVLFLPIGIWLLQPRINNVVEEGDKENAG